MNPPADDAPPPVGPPPPGTAPRKTPRLEDLPAAEQVTALANIGASDADIATKLRCDVDRLRKHYRAELALGRASRRITLRQWQWDQAKEGTASILTMLGKCELGQGEAPEPEEERIIACRTTALDVRLVDDAPADAHERDALPPNTNPPSPPQPRSGDRL